MEQRIRSSSVFEKTASHYFSTSAPRHGHLVFTHIYMYSLGGGPRRDPLRTYLYSYGVVLDLTLRRNSRGGGGRRLGNEGPSIMDKRCIGIPEWID
jgi:hypothetical protein